MIEVCAILPCGISAKNCVLPSVLRIEVSYVCATTSYDVCWGTSIVVLNRVSGIRSLNVQIISKSPELRGDYPPNLSISVSGGKETNKDSLSNGEWTGTSSASNRVAFSRVARNVTYRCCTTDSCERALEVFLNKALASEGASPVRALARTVYVLRFGVGLLESAV